MEHNEEAAAVRSVYRVGPGVTVWSGFTTWQVEDLDLSIPNDLALVALGHGD
jgi:hypothetical protein